MKACREFFLLYSYVIDMIMQKLIRLQAEKKEPMASKLTIYEVSCISC